MLISRRTLLCRAAAAALVTSLVPAGAAAAPVAPVAPPLQLGQSTPSELRVSLIGEPRTLDPARAVMPSEVAVLASLFEGLLRYDQDLRLVPGLAEAVPTAANGGISADGLVYTLRLRDDVCWSDGRPVVAGDFEFALKRLLDPRTGAPLAGMYLDIAGARAASQAFAAGQRASDVLDRLREAIGVRAVDEHTLRITLEAPRAAFPHLLALLPASPIRADLLAAYGEEWTEPGWLVGTGPFVLAARERGTSITLVPNEWYNGETARLGQLTWRLSTDVPSAYQGFLDEQVDLAPVPAFEVDAIERDTATFELVRYPELATTALFFNTKLPPFDNPRIRQAIGTAVDRDALLDAIGLRGARPAYSWIPPGVPGHDSDSGEQYVFNPARAATLLAEAGFPAGKGLPVIRLAYPDTPEDWARSEWLRLQLKRNLGIEIELGAISPSRYLSAIAEGRLQAWWGTWSADYADPDNWLRDLFETGRPTNTTRLSDRQLDQLLARAAAEPEDTARLDLWRSAERRLMGLLPVVPLVHRERVWAARPGLRGLLVTGRDQVPGQWHFRSVELS